MNTKELGVPHFDLVAFLRFDGTAFPSLCFDARKVCHTLECVLIVEDEHLVPRN